LIILNRENVIPEKNTYKAGPRCRWLNSVNITKIQSTIHTVYTL